MPQDKEYQTHSELKAEIDYIRSLLDCRTCQHVYMGGCASYDTCTDANKYVRVIPIQKWKKEKQNETV